jgi:hypothetical protein
LVANYQHIGAHYSIVSRFDVDFKQCLTARTAIQRFIKLTSNRHAQLLMPDIGRWRHRQRHAVNQFPISHYR